MTFRDFIGALETAGGNVFVLLILILFFGALTVGVILWGHHIGPDTIAAESSKAIIGALGTLVGALVMGLHGQQKQQPGTTTSTPPDMATDAK